MAAENEIATNPLREAYFGDLHLHTSYSFDAYVLMGTKTNPDTAYRFAKGETVEFLGQKVRRREPLDFMAVTDHAEAIGVYTGFDDPNSEVSKTESGKKLKQVLAKMATDPKSVFVFINNF